MASPAIPSPTPTSFFTSTGEPPPFPLTPTAPELDVWGYLGQLLVVTVALALLAYWSLKLAKDRYPGLAIGLPSGKLVKVMDRTVVDARHSFMVVNVGQRYWLVASTENHVAPIAELDPEDVAQDSPEVPGGNPFGRLVNRKDVP